MPAPAPASRIEQFKDYDEQSIRVLGDVVERRLHAPDREEFARGVEDALPVAFGVLAQPAEWSVAHRTHFSELRNDASISGLTSST